MAGGLRDVRSSRVKVTGLDFGDIRELINKKPEQIKGVAADVLREIGADAVRGMRQTIETASTKTGQAQGREGRVRDKGDPSMKYRPRIGGKSMRDSVDYEVRQNQKSVSLRFGWLTGRPGYAFFQEYGTKNGVPAMHALTDARTKALAELQSRLKVIK